MEWESKYIQEDGIVATTVHGFATLERIKNITIVLLNLAKQYNSHKFITDYRNISQCISTMEIHSLPQTLLDIGFSRSNYVALVYSADSPDASNFTFFDARCFNSSMNIRVFTDYDEAYNWLLAPNNYHDTDGCHNFKII